MPYLSHEDTLHSAGGFPQRCAAATTLEGGAKRAQVIRALSDCEIPVIGHFGLTPQSVHAIGGCKVQGRAAKDAMRSLEDAHGPQEAGCFALVLNVYPC
jgi:3-methyl-2-oxobutanoate hydroxymethyltransferase